MDTTQTTLTPEQAELLAEMFRALSDPSRVRIIAALLNGEKNVGALTEIVGTSESAVSHQLRTLRQLRLVRAQKRGREVYYKLDDDHVTALFLKGLEHVLYEE